jgi:transcription factor SPN1
MSDSDLDSRQPTPAAADSDSGAGSKVESRLISQDRDTPPAPAANPDLDMDDEDAALSDAESELSEVNEDQFDDFDPATVALDDRPAVSIDEDAARGLTAAKKKKRDGDGKKPKEKKREKKKRPRDEDEDPDGETRDDKRQRKPKSVRTDGERRERDRVKERRPAEPENEQDFTPQERRRRALDKAMDAALKNPNKRRRKKDEVVGLFFYGVAHANMLQDLEEMFDEEIATLKIKMEQACEADNLAREKGQPAIHKLKMLPEVVALLNRNTVQHSIVDPDTNFLQSVKFFLEPLNDGSLPAYNIQRDLFSALTHLPIDKQALLSSGIGKVVLYYTKSKKPEIGIKRTAERLLGEWSRPILKRTDDYKKRKVMTKDFDHQYVSSESVSLITTNIISERHNLLSAHLEYLLHKWPLPNAQICLNVTSIENVYLLNQTEPIEREWSHQIPATQSHRRAHLMQAKALTRQLVLLVQVVWKLSGR